MTATAPKLTTAQHCVLDNLVRFDAREHGGQTGPALVRKGWAEPDPERGPDAYRVTSAGVVAYLHWALAGGVDPWHLPALITAAGQTMAKTEDRAARSGAAEQLPAADPWHSQPTTRLFLVHASGTVEEIDGGGDIAGGWSAPGLYERLLLAGFPLTRDDHAKTFDGLIDVGTDGTRVVANAPDGPRDMGSAEAELFLDWFKRAAT